MDQFLSRKTKAFSEEIERYSIVSSLLQNMVSTVETHVYLNDIERLKQKNSLSSLTLQYFSQYIDSLEQKNRNMQKDLTNIKETTKYTKEKFALESGRLLIDSKKIRSMQARIDELELSLSNLRAEQPLSRNGTQTSSSTTSETSSTSASIPSSSASTNQAVPAYVPPNPALLYSLPDEAQLLVFSFLETSEVLSIAQVCRKAYKRIDALFGMESSIITPEWDNPPPRGPMPAITAPTGNTSRDNTGPVANPEEFKLSRESLDMLTKKLNAQEMKIILGLTDKIKKQVQALDQQQILSDDLAARLENTESVRDFLVDKLKSAELAIKSMIGEISTLKKQSINDNEIISYLDLKVQELENDNSELVTRTSLLQASLDLQIGTHSVREDQLKVELNDYKMKFDKLDRDSKVQKKALVKEVKSLRQQLETLTQEKASYSFKLQQLREAFDGH